MGPGDLAPDVEVQDLSGRNVRLADYKGKVVLLDFWATYCQACHKSIPLFQRMYETYGAKGFEVLGVSIDTYTGNVAQYSQENGMKYRVLLDPRLDMARAFGVRGLPTAFLIGRDGRILKVWLGYKPETADEIESEVKTAVQ